MVLQPGPLLVAVASSQRPGVAVETDASVAPPQQAADKGNGSEVSKEKDEEGDRVSCPICCDELCNNIMEVGALTYNGKRVEQSLYHGSCVTRMLFHRSSIDNSGRGNSVNQVPSGQLQIAWGLSPMTRKPVDGFKRMPRLDDVGAWVQFVNWRGRNGVSVEDLTTVVGAFFPIAESSAERLVREHFVVAKNDVMTLEELEGVVVPYLQAKVVDLQSNEQQQCATASTEKATERYLNILCEFLERSGRGTSDCREKQADVAAALRALIDVARSGDARAAAIAVRRLLDGNEEIRAAALTLLTRLGYRNDERLLAELAEGLRDRDEGVRCAATEAFACLTEPGCEHSVELLCSQLRDSTIAVRLAAVRAIPKVALMGDTTAINSLVARSADSSVSVRENVVISLAQLGDKGDSRVINAIITLLRDKDFKVRRNATSALGRVARRGDATILELVYGMMKESDPDVRWGGVCALAHVARKGDQRAIKVLCGQAVERETWLRCTVLNTLGVLMLSDDVRGRKIVENATRDNDMSVRQAAQRALQKIEANHGRPHGSNGGFAPWRCGCGRSKHVVVDDDVSSIAEEEGKERDEDVRADGGGSAGQVVDDMDGQA
eukprot:TRINITY_DN75561_c0_g1_i1.p1 TRINITY_DN75561_c0_g1~~TRINITY_DN75561_c0_g1_i1.p1  ORF type:complete len:609 (+),score=94.61 TRINITY_DN75561_c0_g1_i1:57-1883(+)